VGESVRIGVLEDHAVLAVEPALQLLHAVHVHDRGAVDAQEALGIEALLESVHRGAEGIALAPRVEEHTVPGRLHEVHVAEPYEAAAIAGLHEQPLGPPASFAEMGDEPSRALGAAAELLLHLRVRANCRVSGFIAVDGVHERARRSGRTPMKTTAGSGFRPASEHPEAAEACIWTSR
jgi:hypothetical protein